MSIEVRIPKEITEYKEKILFGLTIRQLICFASAIVLGLSSYFLISRSLDAEIAGYVVIFEVMPIFAIGFFKKNGFTFEKYIKLILKHKLGQQKRKYQTELSLDILIQNIEEVKHDKKTVTREKRYHNTEQSYHGFVEAVQKGKLKTVKRSIIEARKDFHRAKQETKKATAKTEKISERTANNQI